MSFLYIRDTSLRETGPRYLSRGDNNAFDELKRVGDGLFMEAEVGGLGGLVFVGRGGNGGGRCRININVA